MTAARARCHAQDARVGCGDGLVPGVLRGRDSSAFCAGLASSAANVAVPAEERTRLMAHRCNQSPNWYYEFGNTMYCYAHNFAIQHL